MDRRIDGWMDVRIHVVCMATQCTMFYINMYREKSLCYARETEVLYRIE